MCLSKEK